MKKLLLYLVLFSILYVNAKAQTVYVTKYGKKYHTSECRYIKNSAIEIDLSDAVARGYDACSVCHPPSSTSSGSSPNSFDENKDRQGYTESPKESNESVQCSAQTKKGTQCKRNTKSLNGKCWQHGGD